MNQINLESFYSELPDSQVLQTITYEADLKIVDTQGKQFRLPTVSKECLHPKECYELEMILEQIRINGAWKCETCKAVSSYQDLCKDFRHKVKIEFNELVTNIMIIEGKLFNKSNRKKRFLDHFISPQIKFHLKALSQRYVAAECSINQLMIKELTNAQKINTGKNQRIQYWAYCLQDKIKITIPVRIIGCKHPECYELTSLLQIQNVKQEQFYVCVYPGCDNQNKKINISNIDSLFSSISIDEDLLQIIKKSSLNSMKFIFNYQTQKFEEDVYRENGKIVDPTIKSYYEKFKKEIKSTYDDFQNSVQLQVAQICQNDLFKEQPALEKLLGQYKFRNLEVKMQDTLTNMVIEQPVRCKNCKDFSICLDLKSYACEYIRRKLISQTEKFSCPLCKTQFQANMATSVLSNYIYLDQNLLFRMFKDLSYMKTTKFAYLGQQYMIQEFQERQVLSKDYYINEIRQKQGNLRIEFKSIFCSFNKNLKLSIPLLLGKCPNRFVIDFLTLYQEMEKLQFNLDKGLIFCKCSYCNVNPITQLSGQIFYHEAFDYALKKFYNSKSNQTSFSYDFQNDTLTQSQAVSDSRALQNLNAPRQMGFLDLLNDEEYKNIFGVRLLEGREFQINNITQNICEGIDINYNQQSISDNLKEKKDSMNKQAEKNPELSKYHFKVTTIKLEVTQNPTGGNLDFQE